MKRIFALMLCVLLISALLISCGEGKTEESTPDKSDVQSQSQQSTEPSEEESTDPNQAILNNPDIFKGSDYNGRVFTFWTTNVGSEADRISEFIYNEGAREETLPETVNAAIKTRNDKVYEALGVKIEEIYYKASSRYGSDTLSKVRNFISATDPDINCFSLCLYDCGTLALEQSLYNLYELENLNPENPWWEQAFNESVTIANQLYFTLGDIGFSSKESTPAVYYNTRLIKDLGLEDPLILARNGQWTIDKAMEYSKKNLVDSAEPKGFDYKDQFGWAGQYDDMYAMLYGAGVRILSAGPDGEPVLSINNSTAIGTVDKVIELMNLDCYISGNDYFGVSNTPMVLLQTAFEEGRSLFYSGGIDVAKELDMVDVFGILPVPKYSIEQEYYYSLLNTWVCNAYCIGANLDEEGAEFSAAVLDVMGYYSWAYYPDSLAYNYYEKMLRSQKLVTEDAEAMLDLIFENRGCELGAIFQVGKLTNTIGKTVNDMLIELMQKGETGGFVASYDSYKGAFEADAEALVEGFNATR